eukprot:3174468-Rhodomonas_salina.3
MLVKRKAWGEKLLVVGVSEGGAAAERGVVSRGDEVMSVGGVSAEGQSAEEIERMMGGEAGAAVEVRGKRAGSGEEYAVQVVRRAREVEDEHGVEHAARESRVLS